MDRLCPGAEKINMAKNYCVERLALAGQHIISRLYFTTTPHGTEEWAASKAGNLNNNKMEMITKFQSGIFCSKSSHLLVDDK